jgi:hypothetical protein
MGLAVLVDVCGDVMEMNHDGLIPKIMGRFFKSDVGVVLQIDDETFMTRVMTKSGLIGWGNTWGGGFYPGAKHRWMMILYNHEARRFTFRESWNSCSAWWPIFPGCCSNKPYLSGFSHHRVAGW